MYIPCEASSWNLLHQNRNFFAEPTVLLVPITSRDDKGRGTLVRSPFGFSFFFVFLFFVYSFISSFFIIVTFLGWTRLHATWIKPEVVATKKYTGYLHYWFITTGSRFSWSPCCSYMCFLSSCVALPIFCPSMISCFRCSGPFFGE